MPPRVARASLPSAPTGSKSARNKTRKRTLDAYSIASHSTNEKPRLRSGRLGEFLGESAPKRRKITEDEDGEEDDIEEDVLSASRQRNADDEDGEMGGDSEGNEWKVGGLRSDDEDSELDSDEAFGSSDEERFEGFTFRGSKGGNRTKPAKVRTQKRAEEVDLDEGDSEAEEEEDDFGEAGVDLATMLDDDEDVDGEESEDEGDESGSGEDESASDSSMDEDEELEDDQNNEERAARMRDRLDALDASTQPSATSAANQPAGLTVDDLLATLDPAARKQYDSALKTRKKSTRPTTLTAPLPKRQQDRLNREVASQKAKEQLDRWRDTVIRNRRAEFLSFPLKHADEVEPVGKDKFIIDGQPRNELEDNIQRIMEESGLATRNGKQDADEAAILKSEDLATNTLPVEEVLRRRGELRRARELLFREELKAKRISKIKSKSFRRVHRKERERQKEYEKGLLGSGDEDEREANERKRAVARMSTKHRDSKFAKALRETNRGVWDEGAREAVMEEARRREELERRIRGQDVDGEGSGMSSDGDDDAEEGFEGFDEDEDVTMLKRLNRLKKRDGDGTEGKGIAGLKFMRTADERQRAQNDEDIQSLRRELAVRDGDEDSSDDDAVEDQQLGRAIFGPLGKETSKNKKEKKPEMEEGEESDADREGEQEEGGNVFIQTTGANKRDKWAAAGVKKLAPNGPLANGGKHDGRDTSRVTDDEQTKSAWLLAPAKSRKGHDDVIHIDTVTPSLSKSKPATREKPKAEPAVQSKPNTLSSTNAGNTDGWTLVTTKDDDNDASDAEPTDPINVQSALLRRAFATDDTDASTFQNEKTALIASEDEKDESSTTMPGWGSWTGAGLSKSLRRAARNRQKQQHNPLLKHKTPGTRPENRKDAGLENVVISEKAQRKGKGYMAPILPHGFETKEQYERSLRVPMGPEWTTKEVFQRNTRPRVVVERGRVVEAMERPLV